MVAGGQSDFYLLFKLIKIFSDLLSNVRSLYTLVSLYVFRQYCFCITTKIRPCAALKFRKIIWLEISWYTLSKAFETLIGTVCMTLCANVQPHLNIFHLFLFIGLLLPQSFDVRMPLFLSHYWIPCIMMGVWRDNWDAVKIFCSYQCGRVQIPII